MPQNIIIIIIIIIIKDRTQSTKLKYKNNRETERQTDKESCSANTLNGSGNLNRVKQSNTLIRVVSKKQHVL